MKNVRDLTGQKFGRLKAIFSHKDGDGRSGWHCKCDCGKELTVRTDYLISGRSKSCGCLRNDLRGFSLKFGFLLAGLCLKEIPKSPEELSKAICRLANEYSFELFTLYSKI